MKIKNFKFRIDTETGLSSLIYVVLFLFLLYPYRDYDWGWHVRNGEYLLKTGHILMQDQYSWIMPGYVWVNHSWLYDPIAYIIFSSTSFLGMSVAGAIVGIIPFLLLTFLYKLSYWQKGILACFYFQLTSGGYWQGLRSQMVGNMMLAIVLFMLIKSYDIVVNSKSQKIERSKIYTLLFFPPFFLLWANLHGSFTMGLLSYAIFLACLLGALVKKKEIWIDRTRGLLVPRYYIVFCFSFFASFLVTFINPFTYRVYEEVFKHSTSFLLPYILEWDPAQKDSFFFFIFCVLGLFLVLGVFIRRKLSDLPLIIISAIFFLLCLTARRYNMNFVTVALPLASLTLLSIPIHLERYRVTFLCVGVFLVVALEILLFRVMPAYHLWNYSYQEYCDLGSGCSEKLTAYLLQNPPQGRGFNLYDWGGYLIGRNIPTKLFIDGRMHLWQGKNNFYPFLEYQRMYYEKDYTRFDKYNFDFLIAPRNSILVQHLLEKEHKDWKIEYSDRAAIYLVHKK